MEIRTRMFTTLASLVTAMTGASALLGWMDPSEYPPAEIPPFSSIVKQARTLAIDGVAPHRVWRHVEVLAGPQGDPRRPLLTATSPDAAHHFQVDWDGRIFRTEHWRRQEPGDHRESVLIQVAHAGPGRPMSRHQWLCVRALLTVLREADMVKEPVLLHFARPWAESYGIAAEATFDLAHLQPIPVE